MTATRFAPVHNIFTGEEVIKLVPALESWAMSQSARLHDYVYEDLTCSMEVLERIVLEKP